MTLRNRAKCKNCGDIIESTFRNNFVVCSCYRKSSDRLHKESDRFITSTKTITGYNGKEILIPEYNYDAMYADPQYKQVQDEFHGFFLDGGGDYSRYGGNFEDIEWLTEETVTDQIWKIY